MCDIDEDEPSAGMVERLCEVYKRAFAASYLKTTWDQSVAREQGVRAVLRALAAMGVEQMPSVDALLGAFIGNPLRDAHEDAWDRVRHLVTDRLAPVIAAKDARIAELEAERSDDARRHMAEMREEFDGRRP